MSVDIDFTDFSACRWLCQLGLAFSLVFAAASPGFSGVDTPGKAGGAALEARLATGSGEGTAGPALELRGSKASAVGILARLKRSGVSPAAAAAAVGRESLTVSREFRNVPRLRRLVVTPGATTQALTSKTLLKKIEALNRTGLFEYVEPDWQVHVLQVPTDTSFANGQLWGLRNTGQDGGVPGIDVNAVPAWEITTGSPAVVVGVIDTGIRYTHQDLAANMWVNPGELAGNGTDDDQNGYVDDVFGINAITGSGNPADDHNHGTHVSGTIAAAAFNVGQHVGVAYNVRLMALKFIDASGFGNTSDAIECIDYAIAHDVRILSNSWGGDEYSQALQDAIQAASDAGLLFIAAAGNSAANNDVTPNYPSNHTAPNVVAVAAIDRSGNLAGFSSYGSSTVDIGAPGTEIESSIASSDSDYAPSSGTSMATPHVSGVAALLASQFPGAGVAELKSRLLVSARPLASLSGRVVSNGMVDAYAALTATADGNLELYAAANGLLRAGQPNALFVSVTDILPVTGATVSGHFDGQGAQTFLDDGVAPDDTANDGTYSAAIDVPTGVASVSLIVEATAPGKNPAGSSFPFLVIPPPPNDNFAGRIPLAGSTTTTGSNVSATGESGEPNHAAASLPLASAWWSWTSTALGQVTISTAGSDFDTTLAAYIGGTVDGLTQVAANNDYLGLSSQITFSVGEGVPIAIAVDGSGSSQGAINLAVTFEPGVDTDGDGIVDTLDNCTNVPNANQCDSDQDGYGNRCDGDLGPGTGNGATNAQDTTLFREQLGQPSLAPSYNKADLNCNGVVNAQDATFFRGLLGLPPGPSGLHP